MDRLFRATSVARGAALVWLLVAAAAPASAQIPERFTNLQVLPRDISRADLVRTMRGWASDLGARCHHCHVGPENLQGMDFASDEKPTKRAAREMLRMLQTINTSVVPALPARDVARDGVTCYTCHRAQARPPLPLHEELFRKAQAGGAASAAEHYAELKRQHHGAGRYDFGPLPLVVVANRLVEAGRADDALVLARLNTEQHPQDPRAHVMLGETLSKRGEHEAAAASARRALEIQPGHEGALRLLEQLEAARPRR
jgi:hypothetical protein